MTESVFQRAFKAVDLALFATMTGDPETTAPAFLAWFFEADTAEKREARDAVIAYLSPEHQIYSPESTERRIR